MTYQQPIPRPVHLHPEVIDPTRERTLAVAMSMLRREAQEKPKGEKGAWDGIWDLKSQFSVLQPHWAMTVLKSQGSQFRHVFISPDLDHVPGPKNLLRHLWHSGFTPAQQAVHVIRDEEAAR